MNSIDCRGLECPKPVINTKKALDKMQNGVLEILVDNEVAKENVGKFLSGQGIEFEISEKNGHFSILAKKGEGQVIEKNEENELDNTVIVFSNDKMGQGDDKLGEALMKSFMFALSESDNKPRAMLFLNGGVKLTTEGSDVLETLVELEKIGVEILSCGTCLDFYGLKDKLKIGGITNMYTIIENMQKAGKVINL